MDEAIRSFRRALELDPRDAVTHSNLAYAVSFLPGFDPAAILAENRRWDQVHGQPLPGTEACRNHLNLADPGRRLRIGYVSPDFREHCQSLFTLPVLTHHDRSQVEIFCYAQVPRPDAVTRRIAGLADGWRHGPDFKENRRLEPGEVGAIVHDLLARATPPEPVQGT